MCSVVIEKLDPCTLSTRVNFMVVAILELTNGWGLCIVVLLTICLASGVAFSKKSPVSGQCVSAICFIIISHCNR